ncbi:4051_t:CDS:2 [Entrophospora sp. SA101]|nr:4051_t:CDS:2 [Entrophospora sp. SA101]
MSDIITPTMDTQNFQENVNHASAESEAPLSRPDSSENLENFELETDARPRQFLGTDTEDGIEAILIDKIKPKLKLTAKEIRDLFYRAFKEVCLEIYPDWDHKTLTIASSNDEEKMSLHISTFGLRLKNIAKVAVFTELVRKKLPIDLQEKYIVDNIANKSSFSLRMLNTPSGKLI